MILVNNLIRQKIFSTDGFYNFRSFIKKDLALKIRKELISNHHCFKKIDSHSNHRLFHYPNSPYNYPKWLVAIYMKIMLVKLECSINEQFYLDYCNKVRVQSNNIPLVLESSLMHTWSCFYWYKNGELHERHIDNYGEIAAFLVLTELNKDYNSGGLYAYRNKNDSSGIYMDQFYEVGDLIIFDQARLWHEVKPVKQRNDQIGRLQYYIPTIPYDYMDDVLYFEGHESIPFYSKNLSKEDKEEFLVTKSSSHKIHYSRQNYFSNWRNYDLC